MEFPLSVRKNVLICILSIHSVFLWHSKLSVHDQNGKGIREYRMAKGNNLNESSRLIFKHNYNPPSENKTKITVAIHGTIKTISFSLWM